VLKSMTDVKVLEKALHEVIPSTQENYIPVVAKLLADIANGSVSIEELRDRISSDSNLSSALASLKGNQVQLSDTILSFGAENQVGDVTIRDITGKEPVNITLNIYIQEQKPQTLTEDAQSFFRGKASLTFTMVAAVITLALAALAGIADLRNLFEIVFRGGN
jgi:hypothetical protein